MNTPRRGAPTGEGFFPEEFHRETAEALAQFFRSPA